MGASSKNRHRWQKIKERYYRETGRQLTKEEAVRLGLISPTPPSGPLRPPPVAPPGEQPATRRPNGTP